MKVVSPFSIRSPKIHHFSTTFACTGVAMLTTLYRYAYNVWNEATSPQAWRTDSLIDSVFYIHDYAQGMLRTVWPLFLADFFKAIHFHDSIIPTSNNRYPDDFLGNNFEAAYISFQLALIEEPKESVLRLLVIALDIYLISGRVLHLLANEKTPTPSDLIELQRACFLLKEAAGSHQYFNSTSTKKKNIQNTSDDYLKMFFQALRNEQQYPVYADVLTTLTERFPKSNPFIGNSLTIYFENLSCFVRRESKKKSEYIKLNDRTLQNYYTQAKKTHKTSFCEK